MKVIASVMLVLLLVPVLPAFSQVGGQEVERKLVIGPVADSYTDSQTPALNFGASEELIVALNDRTGDLVISYLKFQVPDIDLDDLVSVSLNLNLKKRAGIVTTQISVHPVNNTEKWEELRINALNAPSLDNQTSVNDTVGFVGAWHSWNIATEIFTLIEKEENEITFALMALTLGAEDTFFSKDSKLSPFIEIRLRGVLTDAVPPSFGPVSFEPEEPSVEDEVEVSVAISDNESGVSLALLHFILEAEVDWSIVEMELRNGVYFQTIPRHPSNSSVFFFIEAFDALGNSNTTLIYSFNVRRPAYFFEIQNELNQTRIALNQTVRFYEGVLQNNARESEVTLRTTVDSYKAEIALLTLDLEKLLADYELLLLDNTKVGREREVLNESYLRVQALYNALRDQYGNLEVAFEGQRDGEESLRAQLDDLQRSYGELTREYEDSLVEIEAQDRQVSLYSLIAIGVAAGFGLVAVSSFSLWYFGRRSSAVLVRDS